MGKNKFFPGQPIFGRPMDLLHEQGMDKQAGEHRTSWPLITLMKKGLTRKWAFPDLTGVMQEHLFPHVRFVDFPDHIDSCQKVFGSLPYAGFGHTNTNGPRPCQGGLALGFAQAPVKQGGVG